MMQKNHAFTLIELLIALTVFAILSIVMAFVLKNTLYMNKKSLDTDNALQTVEIAQALIRHDISQIVDRPITDTAGGTLPAVSVMANELDFTRAGLINPFASTAYSDLQRVNYVYSNHTLYRYSWRMLDRVLETPPTQVIILHHVNSMIIKTYDEPHNANASQLPRGIKITLALDQQGTLTMIIPIASRGLVLNGS